MEYPALLHSRYEDQDGQRSDLYLLELHDKKRISDFAKHVQTWSMKIPIEPSILYFGTPVVLISTLNEDASLNVAPMSSAWWLGWNCMTPFMAPAGTFP